MIVGENIKKIRVKNTKLSQQDIADQLNIDRNTYANWENGSNDIKSEYIPKLAEILNTSIPTLFEEENKSIQIIQKNNEYKDNSTLNGAILIITDKNSVEELVEVIKDKIK